MLAARRLDDRPDVYDRSRACRDVLRHGEDISTVAARYNVTIETLRSWLRVARKRDKRKYTNPGYPTVPYST
jgi:transposase-like protein